MERKRVWIVNKIHECGGKNITFTGITQVFMLQSILSTKESCVKTKLENLNSHSKISIQVSNIIVKPLMCSWNNSVVRAFFKRIFYREMDVDSCRRCLPWKMSPFANMSLSGNTVVDGFNELSGNHYIANLLRKLLSLYFFSVATDENIFKWHNTTCSFYSYCNENLH